jgi:hypothetical protein
LLRLRLRAISCEVLARPVYLCAVRSPHVVDVSLLRRRLHDTAVLPRLGHSGTRPHHARFSRRRRFKGSRDPRPSPNVLTHRRRVLDIRRVKGLDLTSQIQLICDLVGRHRVLLGVVEQNGFQRWIVDELARRPETRGRIFGSTTGRGRADPRDGIPRLKFELLAGTWIMPCGDEASLRLARRWQTELGAFGWRNGRLEGVGEHDDLVVASWYVELAIERVRQLLAPQDAYEIVTGEDLGIERVHISPDY